MKKFLSLITLAVLLVSFAAPILADSTPPNDITSKPIFTDASGLLGFVNTIINWIFTILLVVAVVMILMAAFKFLTSGAKPEETKKAQEMLLYALIAIIIGALAKGLVLVVSNLVGFKATF